MPRHGHNGGGEPGPGRIDLLLEIDPTEGRRVGLETALRTAIRDGRFAPGARLPSQCHGTDKVVYRAGDVFWEPGIDRPHLLAANPNPDEPTRFLAMCVGVPGEPVTQLLDPADLPAESG
jgi:hypothetical protein